MEWVCRDFDSAVVHRSVVVGGMDAGPGREVEASSVVAVVTVDAHSAAADPGSSHSLLEDRSHSAADA